jgi:hypothetical protein
MRSLSAQCGTIRIASVAGELRHISVSGREKARLLWLFRNFSILDFPVLNRKQQQLIARVWHAGPNAGSVGDPLDLVGTIEGFSPKLYEPSVPTVTARRDDAHFGLSSGLRGPAIWTAMVVLLLEFAMLLGPKHRWMPVPRVAAVAAASVAPANNVSSTVTVLAGLSAESAPSDADLSAADAEATRVPSFHTPDARAYDASSPKLKSPHPRAAAIAGAPEKPEVILRVSVDREGRSQEVQFLRGDQKKRLAALNAARHWFFQPCSGAADCEHLLKFTDHGDVSTVQVID